jgi:hypothetical protein
MREAELSELLRVSRRNNESAGITGLMLYCTGNFMQYLEGPDVAIDQLWGKILQDRRHHGAIEMFRQPAHERVFDSWSMGFGTTSASQFEELLQVARARANPAGDTSGRVVELMRAFWKDNR